MRKVLGYGFYYRGPVYVIMRVCFECIYMFYSILGIKEPKGAISAAVVNHSSFLSPQRIEALVHITILQRVLALLLCLYCVISQSRIKISCGPNDPSKSTERRRYACNDNWGSGNFRSYGWRQGYSRIVPPALRGIPGVADVNKTYREAISATPQGRLQPVLQ